MATQARSIASLTISFVLVAIPVKLYSATVSSERISFNLLRQKDGSRVKQQYVAVNDGKIVERSEMVKGYEFAKDQYVMFSPEELKELEDCGLISRREVAVVPLHTEYALTALGRTLEPLMAAMAEWGMLHRASIVESVGS